MGLVVNSSLKLARYLNNVHTWAISFLRHLANISSMFPFWASTDSGFVPNLGPRVWSHAFHRRLFIVLMTATHISPNVFSLRNFLSNIHVLLPLYIHHHSYLLYITFIWTIISFIYIAFCFTISVGLHGCSCFVVSVTIILILFLSWMITQSVTIGGINWLDNAIDILIWLNGKFP
jgi:hypothetical protein